MALWRGLLLMTGHLSFLHPVVVVGGSCCVGLGWWVTAAEAGPNCRHPCVTALWSCTCAGPLPRAGVQLTVDCVLLLGGLTGSGAGLRSVPHCLWLPAIGGCPH